MSISLFSRGIRFIKVFEEEDAILEKVQSFV